MKKVMMMSALVLMVSAAAFAQNAGIQKFFSKYEGDESFSQVNVSGKMFGMMTNLEGSTPEEKAMISAIGKIRGLKILRKEKTRDSRELYKEAMTTVPGNGFEELMSVRDKETDMKFYTIENGGKISELVMVMGGSDEFMLLTIFGEIDLKEISKIGKAVNIDGLQKLNQVHGRHDKTEQKPAGNSKDNKKN